MLNFDVGNPGWTSVDGLADVSRWAKLRPDIAVVEFAMKDAITGSGVSTANPKAKLGSIVDAIRAEYGFCQIFPMTMNRAISPGSANVPNLANYYQAVRDEASAKSVALIDNTPLWGSPSSDDIPDGIHPVRSAVLSVLVPSVASALAPYLA